jgi:hypothetical protein
MQSPVSIQIEVIDPRTGAAKSKLGCMVRNEPLFLCQDAFLRKAQCPPLTETVDVLDHKQDLYRTFERLAGHDPGVDDGLSVLPQFQHGETDMALVAESVGQAKAEDLI